MTKAVQEVTSFLDSPLFIRKEQMVSVTESKKEYIFGDDRDFDSCHVSSLVKLGNGDFIAVWFAGSWEANPDTDIWISKRTASGWERPYMIVRNWCVPQWNQTLFRRPDGRVLLFYKEGKNIAEWKTFIKHSDDNGKTFSEPRLLEVKGMFNRGPSKNKCILLSDGSIAAPGSVEPGDAEIWDSYIDISKDGGETWEPGPYIPVRRKDKRSRHFAMDPKQCSGKGIIQPTLWESSPGHLHAMMRSTSAAVFRSDSYDNGKTWCCAYNTGLPNNNSGIDLVKLDSGDLILVSNPVALDWGPRTPLTVSCSDDNGKTWKEIFTLENESGEFSYPAVIAEGSDVFLTYTWRRERIAFWHLKVSK